MSPKIALHDPVFHAYFWIVLISLAVGGATLGFLRVVLKKDTALMFRTYWSWLAIAGLGLVFVFAGRITTIAGVTLLAIYAINAYGFVCYIIFATALCDVAAFTFGKIFGRHPLRSEISPNKTWEGALGAFGVAMILPWLLRFSFPFFCVWQLILTGLIVGIGGQLGDLSISVIKRDIGTKDMAATIPGHGGILDRIDSLIYVAPLFMHMANYYYPLR